MPMEGSAGCLQGQLKKRLGLFHVRFLSYCGARAACGARAVRPTRAV